MAVGSGSSEDNNFVMNPDTRLPNPFIMGSFLDAFASGCKYVYILEL